MQHFLKWMQIIHDEQKIKILSYDRKPPCTRMTLPHLPLCNPGPRSNKTLLTKTGIQPTGHNLPTWFFFLKIALKFYYYSLKCWLINISISTTMYLCVNINIPFKNIFYRKGKPVRTPVTTLGWEICCCSSQALGGRNMPLSLMGHYQWDQRMCLTVSSTQRGGVSIHASATCLAWDPSHTAFPLQQHYSD